MAIAFDAVVAPLGGFSTWSHTCSGSDRILFVLTRGAATAVTYNSVSLTEIGSLGGITPAADPIKVWRLYGPATGANNVVVTGGESGSISVSYTGAKQSGSQVVVTNTSSSSATTLTTNITTAADGSWLLCSECGYNFGGPPTSGTNLTLRLVNSNLALPSLFDSNGSMGTAGATSGTTNLPFSAGYPIYHLLVAFAPPDSAATGTGDVTFAKPALAGTGTAISVSDGTGSVTFAKPALAGTGTVPPGIPSVTQIPVEAVEATTAPLITVTQIPVESAEASDAVLVDITQIAIETAYAFSGTCGVPAPDVGILHLIRRMRTFLLPTSPEGRWMFLRRLQILLQAGVGLTTGHGSQPYVMIQVSRDGGQTWGPERWVTAGRIGEYDAQAFLVNVGRYRDGAVRIVVTDPVAWTFLSADGDLMEGTS